MAVLNNDGLPVLDSCTFTANYGPSGGAVFLSNGALNATANPAVLGPSVGVLIVGCVFQYNDAYAAGAGRGGAVFGETLALAVQCGSTDAGSDAVAAQLIACTAQQAVLVTCCDCNLADCCLMPRSVLRTVAHERYQLPVQQWPTGWRRTAF